MIVLLRRLQEVSGMSFTNAQVFSNIVRDNAGIRPGDLQEKFKPKIKWIVPSSETESKQPTTHIESIKIDYTEDGDPRRRKALFKDIVDTEKSYVNKLNIIRYEYAQPLRDQLGKKSPKWTFNGKHFGDGKFLSIFSEIDKIYQVAATFLSELEEQLNHWSDDTRVSAVFLKFVI